MSATFIISTSTVMDPDIQELRVWTVNYARFIEDMSMVWREDVVARLVDEHLDRLLLILPINDTNVSGVLRIEFVSVLAASDLLFKTN